MATESATYIDGLDASKPAGTESPAEGDDHLRLIKSTIKATIPNVTGAITASHTELNILDGATLSTAELNVLDGIPATLTATELGYVDGVTSAIQTQLNAKAPAANPTFTGTITTPLTASRAVVTGSSSELAASATTADELAYVNGVTSAIQTQLDGKVAIAMTVEAKSTNFSAAVGYHYVVTNNAAVTFPTGSAYGQTFIVSSDDEGKVVTFVLGSEKYYGGTEVPSSIGASTTRVFRYVNATYGWVAV